MASSEGPKSNLHQQDLSKLDVTKLSALSPEVISRQATINIGTIGHVAHGKSTVVKAISGVQTVRFKNELERNITIKLERLSDTVVRVYQDRTKEKYEYMYIEKLKKPRKRNLSLDEDIDMPTPKKSKKGKNNRESDEYIIEKILMFKFEFGKEYFFVKWKGWPDSANTWEPSENLNNCPVILEEFLNQQEITYCDKIEHLKDEISFGDLLSEESLIKRIAEVDQIDFPKLKKTLIIKLLSMILLKSEDEYYATKLVQNTRDIYQLYILSRKRCSQLISLGNWEEHLNQVDISKKITVENDVDLAGPPQNFTYINQSIPGVGVSIPDDPPIGCDCESCNLRSKSCCGMQGGIFAYTVNKRLRVASGVPIFECNRACSCSVECSNRVVQNGRNIKLCIFRTANGCGWGVKTEQKIRQGQFLCQYVGEVITFEEAEKRGREYDANGLTYLFDLDFNSAENSYTIDAAHLGNVSHFINHSCDPNLGVWAVWGDCLDPNLPMLAFFATRDIEAGEEICFDYLQKSSESDDIEINNVPVTPNKTETQGDEVSIPDVSEAATGVPTMSPVKSRFETEQLNVSTLRNKTECRCGASKCRKYLF